MAERSVSGSPSLCGEKDVVSEQRGGQIKDCAAFYLFRLLHCFLRLRQARTKMLRKTAAASVVRMMTMTDME